VWQKRPDGHIPVVSPPAGQRLRTDRSFERLYRRHRRDVYGAVLRDVRDPDEAEDVTQIAFLNAFRAMRKGEEPTKPRAWLVTIARNVIRRRYRELARRPQEVPLDPEVAAALTEVDGPTAGEIAAALRRLPPSQRAVILLREIQGRSYAEIAAELDLSLAAVETLIFRARRSLSQELELAEHVPAAKARRARALAFLPLPGFGKLSLGLSAGRTAAAFLATGVAMVAIPLTDSVADPVRSPAVERGSSASALPSAPVLSAGSLGRGVEAAPKEARRRGEDGRRPGKPKRSGADTKPTESEGAELETLPAVPTSPVELPGTDGVSAPSTGDVSLPSTGDVSLPSTEDVPLPSTDDVALPDLGVEEAGLPPLPVDTTDALDTVDSIEPLPLPGG
jgi:RNA polymerase sigma-70 factor, ECF subfamily